MQAKKFIFQMGELGEKFFDAFLKKKKNKVIFILLMLFSGGALSGQIQRPTVPF